MILVDMSQIMMANIMMQLHMSKKSEPEEPMVRHMVLNSLRMYRTRFLSEFGEMVLCYDSKHYWRRDYFPEYKHSRRKGRTTDSRDWDAIFGCLNNIKNEIKTNMPYKSVEAYGAEADDIIGTLCKQESEPTMIVSGDKDFIQLHKYKNVRQYSPILKKHVNGHNPDTYIRTHILKGDSSDGVPNVLSPDITFTEGLRQRPLGKKKIETWLESMDSMPEETKRNYQRNEKLINLDKIPQELEEQILSEIDGAPHGDRSKLLNYFIDNKLKELTESIGDF